MRPVRWGILGWGTVGPAHAIALERSPLATLVGVADIDHAARERVARAGWDVTRHRTLEELVTMGGAEAIVVAVPHHLHANAVAAAAALGVHALVEKPLGRTVDECRSMIRVAAEANIALGGVLNLRGYEHLRWVRRTVQEGLAVSGLSIEGSVARIGRPGEWSTDPSLAGGGALLTVGVHYLDLASWWLGPIRRVAGAVDRRGVETVSVAALAWESGALGTIRIAGVGQSSRPVRIVLDGADGGIVVEGWCVVDTWGVGNPDIPPEPNDPRLPYGPGHLAVVSEAAAELAERERFPVDGLEAANTVAVVEAVYRSARSGRWEEVPPVQM